MSPHQEQGAHPADHQQSESWSRGLGEAAVLLLLAIAGFMVLPDRLLAFLATRVSPRVRDTLVLLFVVVWFVVMSWLFVEVQKRRGA